MASSGREHLSREVTFGAGPSVMTQKDPSSGREEPSDRNGLGVSEEQNEDQCENKKQNMR